MHPHWLALDLLVEDGPGSENLSQLQFSMWLVALPAQLYHYVPLPILTRWLTPLLVFRDGFFWRFCSLWPPHILLFSRRGICCEYLQVWNSLMDIFVSTSSVCLNDLEMISPSSVWLNSSGIIRILLSCELDRLEFSVIVIFDFRLGSKFSWLFPFLFYFLVRFHYSWTLCCFFSSCLSRGRRAIYFLV